MDKRASRRKRNREIREVLDIIKTILLVVMAVFVIAFVLVFIRRQLGEGGDSDSKISIFGSLLKKETEPAETESQTETEAETEAELKEGFNRDSEGRLLYMKDGKQCADCWMDIGSALYRFDKEGFAVIGTYEEDAYIYTFSDSGEVTSIVWNEDYREDFTVDYPGMVSGSGLTVYLNEKVRLGRFYGIDYKKSSVSHLLGGEDAPQYTGPGSIQTDQEGYIYWLPIVKNPDEMESCFNRRLYRMKPEDDKRQIVSDGVNGYRVLTGEKGETVIYYSKNGGMYRCGSAACREDASDIEYTEDMDYVLDLSTEGKLFLRTVSGYPVLKETDAFKTGGFTYALSSQGEILSVKPCDRAELGEEGTWYVLTEEVFGTQRSIVVWEDEAGVRSAISSEFSGTSGSFYYHETQGRFFAEFAFLDGGQYILAVTKDGDADLLLGGDTLVQTKQIYGFTENEVIVKNTGADGKISYEAISTEESTPVAVSVEPRLLDDEESDGGDYLPNEALGPGYIGNQPGNSIGPGGGSGSGTGSNGPGGPSQTGPGYPRTDSGPFSGPPGDAAPGSIPPGGDSNG